MPKQIKNSSLTTRLFLEGIEIDLNDEIDISNTYSVSNIREISAKQSSYSKTLTVPGTANNNKLFAFMFDIKSTGSEQSNSILGYSASITNLISGVTITGANMNGASFSMPLANNFQSQSYHNQIQNDIIYIDVSGNTDGCGYIICSVNGIAISSNKINGSISRYYFPTGNYLFNDLLEITIQKTAQNFTGNIGYDLDYKKKMRAYVIQDNQVVLSGYAKIVNAVSKDGLVSYQLQITSDLGGLIAQLANLRLEDLYTNIVPDLSADPSGQTPVLQTFASPYDHSFEIANITQSWYYDIFNIKPYAYPLIDYGNSDTVALTNWRTDTLRPALFAKSYLDDIFSRAGYTYDSAFLNSTYFNSLIIPYKDGNISIVKTYPVSVTSSGTTGLDMPAVSGSDPVNSFYIFHNPTNDPNGVYNTITNSYVCQKPGNFIASCQFSYHYVTAPGAGTAGLHLICPTFNIFVHFEIYSSGSTSPYRSYITLVRNLIGTTTFSGIGYFIGAQSSDQYLCQVLDVPVNVSNAGDTIKARISTSASATSSAVYYTQVFTGTQFPGSASISIVNTGVDIPLLNVSYSTNLDGQYLTFEDFVPKSVKQIDYVNSIIKLFNLYPVQDADKRNHFNIYTRDEFFSNQGVLDWTNKIDRLSDITINPIPELDASQLLFSYKVDKDWWNKQYNSLYGNYTYGSTRIETKYEFANNINDVMSGILFAPTPIIEFGAQLYPGESQIEIINGTTTNGSGFPGSDASSDIVLQAGYFAANGALTPYSIQTTAPTGSSNAGNGFIKAQIGVKILYWGAQYLISEVFNPYSFRVTDLNGNPTTLRRPITQGAAQRISNTYYAQSDGFYYLTNSNIAVPCIYDSSDNNLTHKPVKTELRILHYKKLNSGGPDPTYLPVTLQYTPILQNGVYVYQAAGFLTSGGTDPGAFGYTQFPYCSHLNDPITPTFDLLFGKPRALFFEINPSVYPTSNLYTKFWINTVNEITDKDAKFVDCMLNLNSTDISNLDLSNTIYIDGTNFRINQIKDYSPDGSLTATELIRFPLQVKTVSPMFVNAGPDQIISGFTSATFAGSATWESENMGEVAKKIVWSQVAGPSGVTITPNGTFNSVVSGMASGNTYTFQLYVVDNYGQQGVDTMNITPAGHAPCVPFIGITPTAPITLPTNNALMQSSAVPCFGATIVSYSWVQISGGTSVIMSPSSQNTVVSGITTAGNYVYRVTATDNYGYSAFVDDTLIVNPLAPPTLTLSFVDGGGSFLQFLANLSYAIDANVSITELFADGYATSGCTGSSSASAQYIAGTPEVITVGNTGITWPPDSSTGSWPGTIRNKVYNAVVNGSSVTNGSTLTIGSFTVHIVISSCEIN